MANKPQKSKDPLQFQYDELKKKYDDLENENRLLKDYAMELKKEIEVYEERIKNLNKRIPKDLFS